jgi:hypothetical protein
MNRVLFEEVFRIVREVFDQSCIVRNGMICCGKEYAGRLVGRGLGLEIRSSNQTLTLKIPMQKLIIKQNPS